MPQMSPLNWLSLYTIFTIALILFCMMNYYSFTPSAPQTKSVSKKETNPLQWKW